MPKRSPIGVGLALITIGGSLCVLGYYHRADILTVPKEDVGHREQAFQSCMGERSSGIQNMLDEGAISVEQERKFLQRAEALCRGDNGGSMSLPGQ